MRYIIDGYNVINSSDMFLSPTLEGKRNKLLEFIQFNSPHGGLKNSVTIVFDYKSKNPYESNDYNNKYRMGDIEIVFSGGIISADDIIVKIVDESQNPYEITIITNDKGIRRRISPSGAKYEAVEVFLSKEFKQKNIKRVWEHCDKSETEQINEELVELWLKKQ
ncbi:MAG: NYN domain-containing protein [Endomicrobium sp.]|uniref:NYN domain-containing protein n=1 Tax=Candidatus Endomicrobiellum pyrsonymphae TaxID=1408203 RepID=UPI0035821072|nr:NYN domain-containing protein [Endomicrobium sp.]